MSAAALLACLWAADLPPANCMQVFPDNCMQVFPERKVCLQAMNTCLQRQVMLKEQMIWELRPREQQRLYDLIDYLENARQTWNLLDNCWVWPGQAWHLLMLRDTIGREAFMLGRMPDPLR